MASARVPLLDRTCEHQSILDKKMIKRDSHVLQGSQPHLDVVDAPGCIGVGILQQHVSIACKGVSEHTA